MSEHEFYACIEKRIKDFKNNLQSYEAIELIGALRIIQRLMPPSYFKHINQQEEQK